MASNRARLTTWIQTMIYGSSVSDGLPCRLIRLRHLTEADAKSSSVGEFYIDPNNFSAEHVAQDIEELAVQDANACGGVQRYSVTAWYGATNDKLEKRGGRFTFRQRGEKEDLDEDSFDSETKDVKGHVSQMMRHNEAMVRAMLSGSAETGRVLVGMAGTLARMCETQQTTIMNLTNQLQESLDRKAEREVSAYRAQAIERRKDAVFSKVATLMPYAINRLAGKRVVSEEETPESAMIRGFIKSLSKEQLEGLAGVLGPEQQILVFELAKKYFEEDDGKAAPKQLEEGKKAAE